MLANRCSLMGPSYCTMEQNIFQTRIWIFQKCLVCRNSKADFTLDRHLSRSSTSAKSFLEKDPEEPRKKCLLQLPRRWGPLEPSVWICPLLEWEAFQSWGVYGAFHLCGGLLSHVDLHSVRKCFGLCSGLPFSFPELQKNYISCCLHHDLCAVCTSKIPWHRRDCIFLLHEHSQTTWRMCILYSISGGHWT